MGEEGPRRFGVTLGTVRDHNDPEQRGRLKILVPAIHQTRPLPAWVPAIGQSYGKDARVARGTFLVPEVGATVAVMFLDGDPERPVWMAGPMLAAEVDPDVKSSTRATRDRYPAKSLLVRGRSVKVLEKEHGDLEVSTEKPVTLDLDDLTLDAKVVTIKGGSHRAAREGHAVRVTIPLGTTFTGTVGGSPATLTTTAPVQCDGTITEGANDLLLP